MSKASSAPSDAAAKARILTHMNADHQLSLRLYLAQYCHVPLSGTTTAQLVDMSLQHMLITSSYGRHVVPLEPAMKSLLEARERLVTMHNACLAELHLSDVVVDRYTAPDRAWQWALSSLCLLILTTFPFRAQLRPESGSAIAAIWSLNGLVPGLARLAYLLAPLVWTFVLLIHAAETLWFASSRLSRHWVEVGSAVWWAWVLDCMLEGGGAIARFDRAVKALEAAKKH